MVQSQCYNTIKVQCMLAVLLDAVLFRPEPSSTGCLFTAGPLFVFLALTFVGPGL
jgi:hypothetical protein